MSLLVYVSDVAPYDGAGGKAPAGVHRSLGTAARALEEVAVLHRMTFRHVERVQEAGEDLLGEARVLALFTIGETAWTAGQRDIVERRVVQGQLALLGMHSATDSAYGWPAFGELLGARFAGHPVTARLPLTVADKDHPATSHLPSPWVFEEELYLFRDMAPDLRLLLGVHLADLAEPERRAVVGHFAGNGHQEAPGVLPLAWCIERGRLRSLYTVLGHFFGAYEDTRYMQHLSGAVQWLVSPGQPEAG